MSKVLSREEYDNIIKVETATSEDYQKYVNQVEWHRLVQKLSNSIKRRKTHTTYYENNLNKFIELCEKYNLPNYFNK